MYRYTVKYFYFCLSCKCYSIGFKCEWATVKDGNLWIGSTGILVREHDDENENQLDKTRQGVKVVTPNGKITHMDWSKNYEKISEAIGIHPDKGN